MLIVSNFHDYYDVVMKQGIDKSIVYHRKEQEIKFEWRKPPYPKDYPVIGEADEKVRLNQPYETYNRRNKYNITWILIGFCGKFYPAIHFHKDSSSYPYKEKTNFFAYTYNETEEFIKERFEKWEKKDFFKSHRRSRKYENPMEKFNEFGLMAFFLKYTDFEDHTLFTKIKAPIVAFVNKEESWWHYNAKLKINCELKKYQFYKAIDPYMAFQELEMYISGVLGVGEPKITKISDRDMKFKKGFDQKSFRTDPGTRKPRWLKRKLRDL